MFRASVVLRGRRKDAQWLKNVITEIAESGDRPRGIPPRRWEDTRLQDQESHPHLWAARNTPGKRALNPRKLFVAQRVMATVVDPSVSIIVHYNGMDSADWHQLRQEVQQTGFGVTVLPNLTTRRVLENTPYANMAPLFWSSTCVVSGNEVANLKKVLKVLKAPTFAVVGAKLDNRLLTPQQLDDAAKLPSLDMARATLVATISPASQLQLLTGMLQQPAQDLHSSLEASQSDLVSALGRFAASEESEKQ